MHGYSRHYVPAHGLRVAVLLWAAPIAVAQAQNSPFMTGATALQTNILILRCSGSEHGGTSQFASRLIGDREVTRTTSSRSRRATEFIGSISQTEHTAIESAVMGSQIEQLPDLTGYLKLASSLAWQRVSLRSPAPSRRAESVRSSARILEFPSGSTPVARGAARCAQPPRESAAAAEGFELE